MTLAPPFWPFYMAFAVLFTLIGIWRGQWVAPTIILGALIAMRGVVLLPHGLQEIAGGAVWISAAALLCYFKWYVAGFFACLSGLTYPILLTFGYKIVTMGLAPIIADAFLIAALAVAGGGSLGLGSNSGLFGNTDRPVDRLEGPAINRAKGS